MRCGLWTMWRCQLWCRSNAVRGSSWTLGVRRGVGGPSCIASCWCGRAVGTAKRTSLVRAEPRRPRRAVYRCGTAGGNLRRPRWLGGVGRACPMCPFVIRVVRAVPSGRTAKLRIRCSTTYTTRSGAYTATSAEILYQSQETVQQRIGSCLVVTWSGNRIGVRCQLLRHLNTVGQQP